MKNSTLGGWLLGLTVVIIVLILLSLTDKSGSFNSLLGFFQIVQIFFAIMAAYRLLNYWKSPD